MDSTRYSSYPWWQAAAAAALGFTLCAQALAQSDTTHTTDSAVYYPKGNVLIGRAVLLAATFAPALLPGNTLASGQLTNSPFPL